MHANASTTPRGHLTRLGAVPDLSESLRTASTQIKRQIFRAFDLQIAYDKTEGRVEISATVSEGIAKALEGSEDLFGEGPAVTLTNVAGARFVSRYHVRIVVRVRLRAPSLPSPAATRA